MIGFGIAYGVFYMLQWARDYARTLDKDAYFSPEDGWAAE